MKRYMDMIAGLAFLTLAAALYIGSYSIRTFSDTAYGVTLLPRATAVVIAFISLIVLFGGIRKLREGGESGRFDVSRSVCLTTILIFIYIYLWDKLGFILSTILYTTLQVYILSEYSRKRLILGAVISAPFSVGVYFLFTRVIYIMLPPGILG